MVYSQVYDIPESRYNWFLDQLSKLEKKAKKLIGQDIKFTNMVIGFHYVDAEGIVRSKNGQNIKIYEVFLGYPEVKLNGWNFVARIDHSQDLGNVIRVVPGETVPEKYRTSDRYCEHCNIKRYRRDTFIVRNEETAEYKQVGKSCLKDFIGHMDADRLSKLAELLAVMGDYAKGYGAPEIGHIDYRWFNTNGYLAYVASEILQHGWKSRKDSKEQGGDATSDIAFNRYNNEEPIHLGASKLVHEALSYVLTFEENDSLSNWEHNALVIAKSEALELRHLGIAASIIGVYFVKFMPSKTISSNEYVGELGKRCEFTVNLDRIYSGDSSSRHLFFDVNGNQIIWFATNNSLKELCGKTIKISGNVKAHQEYKGKKQTIVNRVKVL